MRIPLDYYRVLGLPTQASAEQLQQAYHDRTLQLPRREYSEAAITARKQLLEEAYAVLSAPKQRARYDANYFSQAYESESQEHVEHTDETSYSNQQDADVASAAAVESHTASIEITNDLFVGALLILQELGEYELVLNLGHLYLSNSGVGVDSNQKSEFKLVRSDIALTVALACLELGREQWQQGQYENAATSLENGQNLLLSEELFTNICNEIQADLAKLRPYRILELLALPENHVLERRQGLQLLQDMLQQRGGIDGTGNDWSGLSIDDFLRFIQQLRGYLTVAEQQNLFEVESKRPSAVATYLTVYALIARGFTQRMPVLIRQAKLLVMRLGKRQDLYLEQAICSLLLGQTAEASRALELSQEYESLAFIREHSQGSPDLLPGLCLYSERWLQTEVFPHFRDLAAQHASLRDYFANSQVQAYLEVLSKQGEVNKEWALLSSASVNNDRAQRLPETLRSGHSNQAHKLSTAVITDAPTSQPTTKMNAVSSDVAMPAAERVLTTTHHNLSSGETTALAPVPPMTRRRTRGRVARGFDIVKIGAPRFPLQRSSLSFLRSKKTRLVLLAVAGVLGVVVLGFLANQTYAWLRQTLFPAPSLQGEQPLVQLDQPPLPIPEPASQPLVTQELLNQETAQQVLETWLATKKAAFSSNHALDGLEQILVQPALLQWQRLAQNDRLANRYRQYKHSLKVNSVQTSADAPNIARVEAAVNEVASVYENGKLSKNSSYDDNLRVRYNLIRQDGQWRIREMRVLR